MADLAQLESALIKADAAGDVDGARILAGEIRKVRSAKQPASKPFATGLDNPNAPIPSGVELFAGNPATRFALGAASPIFGAAQLGAELLGSKGGSADLKTLEQAKRAGMKAYGDETDIAGFAGTVFSPAFLAAAKAIPGATTYIGKILQGMGMGAAAGATSPITEGEDFAKQKAIQTGVGAGAGGAISAVAPAVAKAVKVAYSATIEPWLNPTAIKGRGYLEAAGDKADEIISLLRQNKEIIAGSKPIAGEAATQAGRAEFSAMQRSAANVKPSDYLARSDEQNAARIAAIQRVGQDKASLEGAEAVRKAASDPLYKAAREGTAPVDTGPVMAKVDLILSKNPGNRELVTELNNIRKGLEESGSEAQKVASVLDGLKTSIANKDNAFIKGVLNNIKTDLSKAIPGYERAQAEFAKRSIPINQMQVGQFLEQKLVPAADEGAKQKAASYAGALRDAPGTIKRATGAPRFEELTQALNPKQMEIVNSIKEDLARGARFETMAVKGGKAAPNAIELASGSMEREAGGKLPNLLHRGAMVANAIITRLEGKVNKKLASEMAMEMLNPPAVAESMVQAQAREIKNKGLAKLIQQYTLSTTGGAIQATEKAQQ